MNSTIDYTYLKPFISQWTLIKMVQDSINNGYRGICVFPEMAELLDAEDINDLYAAKQLISVVVGFPFGVDSVERKLRSLPRWVTDVDFVVNLQAIKDKNMYLVQKELSIIRSFYQDFTLKAIIESELLEFHEIEFVSNLCNTEGIDFIKSCSGFHGQVSMDKLKVMVAHKGNCLVKASGGIGTNEKALEILALGADVIGSSAKLDLPKKGLVS